MCMMDANRVWDFVGCSWFCFHFHTRMLGRTLLCQPGDEILMDQVLTWRPYMATEGGAVSCQC